LICAEPATAQIKRNVIRVMSDFIWNSMKIDLKE